MSNPNPSPKTRWPKGFCPNPGGMPSGPKLSTLLARFLEKKTLPNIEDPKLTEAERCALSWAIKIRQGEPKARQQALDRLEGPIANINFNANTQDMSGQGYEALCDAYFKAKQRQCPPTSKEK